MNLKIAIVNDDTDKVNAHTWTYFRFSFFSPSLRSSLLCFTLQQSAPVVVD